MLIRRLQNRGDYSPEVLDPHSETIPDQALTVRDIITRFTRGQMELPPLETGEPDGIDDAESYDDIVDASEAFERGASVYQDIINSKQSQDGQKDKDSIEQDIEVDSLSPQ